MGSSARRPSELPPPSLLRSLQGVPESGARPRGRVPPPRHRESLTVSVRVRGQWSRTGLHQRLLVPLFAVAQLCLLGALSVPPVPVMACPLLLGPQYHPAAALGAAMCPRGLAPFTGDGFRMKIQCGGASEPSAISLRPRRPACGPGSSFREPLPICPRGSRDGARAGARRPAQTWPGTISKHRPQGPSGQRAGALQRERSCPLARHRLVSLGQATKVPPGS